MGCLAGRLIEVCGKTFKFFWGTAELGQDLPQTITISMDNGNPVILSSEVLDVQGDVFWGEFLDAKALFCQGDGSLAAD